MAIANDADLVRLIKDGRLFLGPYGAGVPDGWDFVPGPEYADIGYYSEDGFSLTPEPGDNTQLKAHNKDIVYDEDDPGRWVYAFAGIQGGRPITEAYYDTEVDPSDGSFVVTKASVSTYRSLIGIGEGSNGETILYHAPKVKVTDRESVVLNATTLNALGMSLGTFKDTNPASPYHFKGFDSSLIDGIPTIVSATPVDAAAAATVTINGNEFTGTTGVKFGATAATSFVVLSNKKLTAVMPAGTAGPANIVVTNAEGPSTAFTYTRGA